MKIIFIFQLNLKYLSIKNTVFNIIYLSLNIIYLSLNIIYLSLNIMYLSLNIIYLSLNIIYLSLNIIYLSLNLLWCRKVISLKKRNIIHSFSLITQYL
jgi:integrin beta 3